MNILLTGSGGSVGGAIKNQLMDKNIYHVTLALGKDSIGPWRNIAQRL